MKFTGFVCQPIIYEFKGWTFELTHHSGPWPLNKDGDPRECAGRTFYKMYDEFSKLTEEGQDVCRIGSGCQRINSHIAKWPGVIF